MNLNRTSIPRVAFSSLIAAVALLAGIGAVVIVLFGARQAQAVQPGAVQPEFPAVSQVKDINPGTDSSNPDYLVVVSDTLFFVADDGATGGEVWKSDGSNAGTLLVKDIATGTVTSDPEELTPVRDKLFFRAREDASDSWDLWTTDGSEAGTVMIAEDMGFEGPGSLTAVGDLLFFVSPAADSAAKLWKSDGTVTGTEMITHVILGGQVPDLGNLIDVDGTLFFTTKSGRLCKSDGTVTGTVSIADADLSLADANRASVDGILFFSVDDRQLWKSDGTVTGTVMVVDVFSGTGSTRLEHLTDVGGTLFFRANDGVHGTELWKSDGTLTGTVMVKDINELTTCDSIDRPGMGSLACGSLPGNLTDIDSVLFFGAGDGIHGRELWKSDGTITGTVMVVDINALGTCDTMGLVPGTGSSGCSSDPLGLAGFNHKLVFRASDGSSGYEPWLSDGTVTGTFILSDIVPGDSGSLPLAFTVAGDRLLFSASSAESGRELWSLALYEHSVLYLPIVLKPWEPAVLEYGIQAHYDTARVVQAVQDLGLGWIKQQVRWEHVEPSKGNYDWDELDIIADTASAGGVKVLFSVIAAPVWARGGEPGRGPPDNYQDFYDFMGAMAAHFQGRVHAYEIWNEQNLSREWEGAPLNAADYVRLLQGAYLAIKAADPGAIVVSGGPTPTGINDGVLAIDDRVYLEEMYAAGLENYCDAVGAHPSGYANPPDVYYTGGDFDPGRSHDDHRSFFFRNTMEDYYAIMVANGDGSKPIWATEFGWGTTDGMGVDANDGYEFTEHIDQSQQADYIVRAFVWSRNWGHAGTMFLWNLNFWPATRAENEMAKYSIVRDDWSPRPAYNALRDMPK